MSKVLLPVQDPLAMSKAVQLLARRARSGEQMHVHLLHVDRPLSKYVSRFLSRDNRRALHRERGERVLETAASLLRTANISASRHALVGDPARSIVEFAHDRAVDRIMMPTRGMGSIAEMMLGSVTANVVRRSQVPVEVVPMDPRSRFGAYAAPTGAGAGILTLLYLAFD